MCQALVIKWCLKTDSNTMSVKRLYFQLKLLYCLSLSDLVSYLNKNIIYYIVSYNTVFNETGDNIYNKIFL